MKIKCIIKQYTPERSFMGEQGERIARDIVLTQVNDNPLVEVRYPNEFRASYFAHIDDSRLALAVANRTVMTFDLAFRVRPSKEGTFLNQVVKIDAITE